MRHGSLDFALLTSLTFPSIESMNVEELCNCFSCEHRHCSDNLDEDKCPETHPYLFIQIPNFNVPSFNSIVGDLMRTRLACRQCGKL